MEPMLGSTSRYGAPALDSRTAVDTAKAEEYGLALDEGAEERCRWCPRCLRLSATARARLDRAALASSLPLGVIAIAYGIVYVYIYWDGMEFASCSRKLRTHIALVAAVAALGALLATWCAWRFQARNDVPPPPARLVRALRSLRAASAGADATTKLTADGDAAESGTPREDDDADAVWRRAWRRGWVAAAAAVAVADYTVCGVLVAEAYCAASNCPPSVSELKSSSYRDIDDTSKPNVMLVIVDDLRYDSPYIARASQHRARACAR